MRARAREKRDCSTRQPRAPHLLYVVTEDWFFASHFLPMARAAREMGFDVAVVARVRDHRAVIEAAGVRLIPLEAERHSADPLKAVQAMGRLATILRREKPDIVHCIALRSIVVGGAACLMARIPRRVFAPTGLGIFDDGASVLTRLARLMVRALMRGPLETATTRYIFENQEDPGVFGLDPRDAQRVTIVGGAGIDPDHFTPMKPPPHPPLRVAVVSRMLWTKGIDAAVDAVRIARAAGSAVELSLFGSPDTSHAKAIPEQRLHAWSAEEGITWFGPTQDVRGVWRDHHICCLPSHREGMPRSLLEGAACGRALLTTDVTGCRTLVRNGIEGFVVPPDDSKALAEALIRLAGNPGLVARMGAAARLRVLDGFTERDVAEAVKRLYAELYPVQPPSPGFDETSATEAVTQPGANPELSPAPTHRLGRSRA